MQLKPRTVHSEGPWRTERQTDYEIDYNSKGNLKDVIPVLDNFITRIWQKFIGIAIINQPHDTV